MPETIRQFFDACQPFGYPLLACSIILFAAILYHLLFTSGRTKLHALNRTPLSQIRELCRHSSDPLSREVLFLAEHRQEPDLEKQVESRLRLLMDCQRAGLATISVITNVAPMLGILGTAWGLVDIFGVFGTPEAQEGIAQGISKALYTTIAGLAIAVPGMIALTWFERRLERRAAFIHEFFTQLLANRDKL